MEEIKKTLFNAIISQRESFIDIMYNDTKYEVWIPLVKADSQKKREELSQLETEKILKLITEEDEEQKLTNWLSNCKDCFRNLDKNDRKALILDQLLFNQTTEQSIELFVETSNAFYELLQQRSKRAMEEHKNITNFFDNLKQ